MAEFVSEASLDLFQDFFHPRSSQEESADNEVDCEELNRSVSAGSHGFRDTSQGSGFVKTAVHQHNIEEHNNTIVLLSSNSNDFIQEFQEILSPEADNNSQQLDEHDVIVRLQNLENLKKSAELNNECVSVFTEAPEDGSNNSVHGVTVKAAEQKSDENDIDKACAKNKRGISFPKDTFISGYFEPPDPWKNAPSWTTDELVAAYKKSCELHGAKPIAKLVQQLQTCSPGKLEESLNLKGEKLDQKQCECLEEVLRRVQFRVLDLESSHLDEECAVALFDMIEYYESACQLNIACNRNIQIRGWQACSRLVRRTPSLTYLDIRGCDLNDRHMPIFGRALKLGCHLTILHMENMTLSGRPLVILVAALKTNETLQELFLADNKLMPSDGVQLGNLLHYNRRLGLLDLRNNHLQDVGASHISDGLVEQSKGPGLKTLVLWNNAINYQAMPALGRALIINETLETLNVGHNAITNEGIHLLKDGLLKTNSLLRLGLQGAKITDEGAVALAEYIADSTILLRIDLRDNEIKTGGLMALSHAMRVNRSVTRVDLDKEPKKDSSMKDYAEQQSLLLRDIYTFQQRNIQAALQREEEQQVKLETKPVEVQATESGEEKVPEQSPLEQEVVSCLLESKDGATVTEEGLEPPDRLDTEDGSSQDKVEVENVKEDEELNENEIEDEDMLQADIKLRQRPSVLFPYFGLQPQASLDSPLPVSGVSPLMSELPGIPQSPPLPVLYSHKNHLSLSVGCTPGEMILSPQYFPKQFARKIFSVSRVSEDPSWQPSLSTSPTPLCTFASAGSLVSPASSLPSSLPMPLVSLPAVVPEIQHSPPTDVLSVSPSSPLFHNLVNETMRHMVSPITDEEIQDVFAETKEPEQAGDSLEQGVALAVSGTPDSDIDIEPSVFTSCLDSLSKEPTPSSVDSCDNSQLSGTDIVIELSPSAGCVLQLAGSGEKTRVVNLTGEIAVSPAVHDLDSKAYMNDGHSQDCLSSTKDIRAPAGVSPSATLLDPCSAQAASVSVAGGTLIQSGLDKLSSGCVYLDRGWGDGAMPPGKNILTHDGTPTEHSLQHLTELGNACCVEGFSMDEVITSTESNHPFPEEELVSFQLNNNSNSVLGEQSEQVQEQPTSHSPGSSPASQSLCDFNQSGSCFSREDQAEQTVSSSQLTAGSSRSKLIPLFDPNPSSASTHSEQSHLLSSEKPTSAASVTSEAVSNDRIRVKPDGDSWSVDQDKKVTGHSSSLSINGFNQELTSAATLFEQLTAAGSVSSGGYDDDGDTILAQLQPPDEFERELDAMLAIVQSELPWPLKDS